MMQQNITPQSPSESLENLRKDKRLFPHHLIKLYISAFPQHCHSYNGPHSEACLRVILEDAGCLPNEKGFLNLLTTSKKEIFNTMTLK